MRGSFMDYPGSYPESAKRTTEYTGVARLFAIACIVLGCYRELLHFVALIDDQINDLSQTYRRLPLTHGLSLS